MIDEASQDTSSPKSTTSSSQHKHFEPYTQKIILQVEYKTNGKSAVRSIPLAVEVFTSRWEKNADAAPKVLRLVAKLLQQLESLNKLVDKNNWKEMEFDYENELTVKLFARTKSEAFDGDEIGVRITRSSRLQKQSNQDDSTKCDPKLNKVKQKFFASVSSLIEEKRFKSVTLVAEEKETGTSFKPEDQKLIEYSVKNEADKVIKPIDKPAEAPKYVPAVEAPKCIRMPEVAKNPAKTPVQSSLKPIEPVAKCLPRLLCRNRNRNLSGIKPNDDASSPNAVKPLKTINKTGMYLKEVDSLFEKIKLNPNSDKFENISKNLLESRPSRVQFDSKRDYLNYLFNDEIYFFRNK